MTTIPTPLPIRRRAQLPDRRSYKPTWRPAGRARIKRAAVARIADISLSRACAPEGAWPREVGGLATVQ